MNRMLALFALLSLASASSILNSETQGQTEPERCCGPDVYQLTVAGAEFYETEDSATYRKIFSTYGRDDSQGLAAFRNFDPDSFQYTGRVLFDYRNQVVYDISVDGSCVKTDVDRPAPISCVRESAAYIAQFRMGAFQESLLVNVWLYRNASLNYEENLSFTTNCIPVGRQVTGNEPGASFFSNVGFTDPELEITDEGLLDIPEECAYRTKGAKSFSDKHVAQFSWF